MTFDGGERLTEAPALPTPDLLEPTSAENVFQNVDRILDLVAQEADRSDREGRLSPLVGMSRVG